MSNGDSRLSILIADDEPLARERLAQMLRSMAGEFPIGEILLASDGLEAFETLTKESPDGSSPVADLVFLDIRMPKLNGLELALHLSKSKRPPLIVFVTAYDEYAVRAFEAEAIDYILKPARKERLREAFEKILRVGLVGQKLSAQAASSAGMSARSHISISERGRVLLVPVSDILYFKSELKYTTIKTSDKEYLTEEPLLAFEEEFSKEFVRIHRNCLISRPRLRGFEKSKTEEGGWCAILDGISEKLPVSRRQWAQIREAQQRKTQ